MKLVLRVVEVLRKSALLLLLLLLVFLVFLLLFLAFLDLFFIAHAVVNFILDGRLESGEEDLLLFVVTFLGCNIAFESLSVLLLSITLSLLFL